MASNRKKSKKSSSPVSSAPQTSPPEQSAAEVEAAEAEVFAEEYSYVGKDLRHLTIVSLVLFAIMFGVGFFI